MPRFPRDNGLSVALLVLFLATLGGQTLTGWRVYNDDQQEHGAQPVGLRAYLGTGHYGEAVFENWESEFLALLSMVVLSIFLRQRGSPESKPVARPHHETGSS